MAHTEKIHISLKGQILGRFIMPVSCLSDFTHKTTV